MLRTMLCWFVDARIGLLVASSAFGLQPVTSRMPVRLLG